jgi:hypothetical protein
MILMNPYFHVPQAVRPNFRENLTAWSLRSRLGGAISGCFALLKEIRLFLNRKSLPKNANKLLIRRFKEVASAGLPILVLNNKDRRASSSRTGEFDYLAHILKSAGRKGRVAVELLEGADHSLSNRVGRMAARQHAEQWLHAFFPLTDRQDTVTSTSRRNPGDSQNSRTYREHVAHIANTY